MTAVAGAGRALALSVVLAVAACAEAPVKPGEAKKVTGMVLAPYAFEEECMHLNVGDRLELGFESSAPVAFNIHYHEGNAILMPRTLADATSDASIFIAPVTQDYCLMWEAGAAGAIVDYRLRLRSSGG